MYQKIGMNFFSLLAVETILATVMGVLLHLEQYLYEAVMATELTGEIHAILAAPFGSEHKPTAESKHRVVTFNGRVYVKQGDMYYSTQKLD